MSWITDHKQTAPVAMHTQQEQQDHARADAASETLCRVYGHRLSAAATAALSSTTTTRSGSCDDDATGKVACYRYACCLLKNNSGRGF